MKRHFKRRWYVYVILVIVLYLAGAMIPFARYQQITDERAFDLSSFAAEEGVKDRAMLLETNQSAWDERIRLLNMAEKRIIISTFDMRPGQSTKDIMAVLQKKAKEDVKISILVDGISGFLRMEGEELFYALSSYPNVEIKIYNPIHLGMPWKLQGRMHDKYVIVDDIGYILGGRNMFDYFIGEYKAKSKSHDREVLIYNENHGQPQNKSSLYEVEEYFNGVWNKKECKLFHDDSDIAKEKEVKAMRKELEKRYDKIRKEHPQLFEDPDYYKNNTYETNGITLLANPTGIYGKEPKVFAHLCDLMKQAKESVQIHTPYIVCNDYMYKELMGVGLSVPKAEIVINSVENGDNFVASSDYIWNKKDVVGTGMQIYEYDGGTSMHGKSIVIDSEISIVGSYNMDLRSTYMDTEIMLVIKSKGLANELEGHMEEFKNDCRKVINEKEYEVPAHVKVEELPFLKKAAMRIVGLILQPFRYVV